MTETATETATETTTWDISVCFPVDGEYYISDVFGNRTNPVTGKGEFHKGIDIAVVENTPVYAAFDGIVENCGLSESYGNYIKIKGEKYTCLYGHLNKVLLNKGESVKRGEKAALSGSTGQSTGPHLHFELYEGDQLIDPSPVIENICSQK